MRPVGHSVHACDRRNERLRTGAEQQVVALIHLFAAAYVVLVHHFGRAWHDLYIMGRQLGLDTQHQLTHHLLLAGDDFRQIEAHVLGRHGILRRMARAVVGLGRIQQRLGGDAALVQADTPQAVFLKEHNAQSCPSGSFGGGIARRASADNGNLISFHGVILFLLIYKVIRSFLLVYSSSSRGRGSRCGGRTCPACPPAHTRGCRLS